MKQICWKAEWAPLALRFADQVAVTDLAGSATYDQLFSAAAGHGRCLGAAGTVAGDVVAVLVPNSRHAVAASHGVALTGAIEVPINPALAHAEVVRCLELSGARRMVTTRGLAPEFSGCDLDVLVVEDVQPSALADFPEVHVGADSWSRILFTSGTTGHPKGIAHSHGGRWIANLLLRATLPATPEPGRKVLLMTPYAHGASLLTQAFLDGGAAVLLLDGVDTDAVADAIRGGDVDHMFAPPTVLAKIVGAFEGQRIDSLKAIFCGTAPLTPELYRRAKAIFGPVVRITYGKTELFNPITVLTPAETDRWYSEPGSSSSTCVGWPASGVELAIAPEQGELQPGDAACDRPPSGPVLVRAQHMLAATITADGVVERQPGEFHRTGDLGYVDPAGRLHLVGREADVIKTGGYRVTPEEIEGALRPSLAAGDLVVVGLPSAYWGEVIAVVVAGAPAGWHETLMPALSTLTRFKQPRLFAELPEISRNALGKVMRSRTRDEVLDRYTIIDGQYPRLAKRTSIKSGS